MAKIMLVEDDNNLSEIYQARMMAEGYTIVSAHDGEEALALAAKEKPDLIISDVMMPKISGFEMLDILRNTQGLKDTKVIMLTALGQAEDKTRADSLGADKYLVKSQVTLEDIVKSAQELLNGDSATAQPAAPAPAAPAPVAPVQTPVATPPAAAPTAPATMPVAQPPVTPTTPVATTPTTPPVPQATPVTTVPAPQPAPQVQPAAPAPAAPAPVAPDTTTQSTAQEAAAIQNQIASFEQAPAPTPPQPVDTATAVDNKIVNDAVNTLVANTPGAAPVQPQPAQPAPQQTPAPADAPDVTLADTATDDDPNPATRRKIIKPIETDNQKPDLNSLLAAEEAKASQTGIVSPMSTQQAAAAPTHQPGNIYAPSSEGAGQNTGIDPNSISL